MIRWSDFFLEKLAEERSQSEQEKKERELFRRFQSMGDPLALQQLLLLYKSTLELSAKESGLTSAVGADIAYQMAQNEFIHIAKNKLNLNNRSSKPNSYIRTALTQALANQAKDNRPGAIRTSQSLERYSDFIRIAENQIKRQNGGLNPSDEEVYSYVKNIMKKGGRGFTRDVVKRLREEYSFKELSGSMQFGNRDGKSTAENLTYGEVFANMGQKTPQQLIDEADTEKTVAKEIDAFTTSPAERRYLRQIYKMGIYKNINISRNNASLNNGITNYKGLQLEKAFQNHLKKKGII